MGEFSPNLNYNANDFTEKEWAQIKVWLRHRTVLGIRTLWIADKAGRTHYKPKVKRWLYERDLLVLVPPKCVVVLLVILAVVITVVGVSVL